MSRRTGGGTRPRDRILRAALLTWPRRARARDGEPLIRALADQWAERRVGTPGVLAEALAIARAGLRMRWRALREERAWPGPGFGAQLRTAARSLRRNPAYAVTVIATFSVGIGANAAVLGVVDGVLWARPSFDEPERLAFVWRTLGTAAERFRISGRDAARLEERSDLWEGVAFVARPRDGGLETDDGSAARHVSIGVVSPELFELLGVSAILGRTFAADDGGDVVSDGGRATLAPEAVVLAHDLWMRAFAADPSVLDRTVRIDGRPAQVVGVLGPEARLAMPPGVGMRAPIDVWSPLGVPLEAVGRSDGRAVDQDSDDTGAVVARLRAGVTFEQARGELGRIAAELRAADPAYATASVGLTIRPVHDDATRHLRPLLAALSLGTGVLLIVTCLNLSALSLVRALRRRGEMTVRAALGAPRRTLLRDALLESMLLAVVAAVVAGLVGRAATAALMEAAPAASFGTIVPPADPRVFLAWIGAGTLVSLLCAVLPAVAVIGRSGVGAARLRGADPMRTRGWLVAAQVAFSLVLLVATATLARAVGAAYAIRPGFEPDGAVTWATSVRLPGDYLGPADRARLMREIETAVADVPTVRAVGYTTHLPLSGRRWTQPYGLPGQADHEWAENRADFRTVSSGYFEAMGVRVLAGRAFSRREDLSEDERVVVVDERLARRLGTVADALGATLGFPLDGARVEARVVGVVEHVRHDRLDADGRETIYVPYRQEASREVSFVARIDGAPSVALTAIGDAVRSVDARLPVHGLRTLASYVDDEVAPTTFGIGVVGAFAALVLLSVAIGLYGVIALDVSRRTREIGVRLAIGAGRGDVVRSIVRRGAGVVGAGLLGGAVLTVAVTDVLAGAARGTSPLDASVWAAALVGVLVVAGTAMWLPATRASRLDPTEALRSD